MGVVIRTRVEVRRRRLQDETVLLTPKSQATGELPGTGRRE